MTNGAPARIAVPNGVRYGSPLRVTRSVTPALTSVLAVTRPRPGKCLTVASTLASASPAAKAPPRDDTRAGVYPYCRWNRPMGGLCAAAAGLGTVSRTGPRSTLTPAACSWLPHFFAYAFTVAAGQVPWVSAVGIVEKPGPRSTCTSPPSWSVEMNSGTPAVAALEASRCSRDVTVAVAATPAVDRPVRITLPTWSPWIARSVRGLISVAGVPTMNSWPTRWGNDIAARASAAGAAAVSAESVAESGTAVADGGVSAASAEGARAADAAGSAARVAAPEPTTGPEGLAAAPVATEVTAVGLREGAEVGLAVFPGCPRQPVTASSTPADAEIRALPPGLRPGVPMSRWWHTGPGPWVPCQWHTGYAYSVTRT
jgi:hypothetical protein